MSDDTDDEDPVGVRDPGWVSIGELLDAETAAKLKALIDEGAA